MTLLLIVIAEFDSRALGLLSNNHKEIPWQR